MSLPAAAVSSRPPAPPPGLSRHQKATIIVRLVQSEGIELSLAELPDDLQVALAQEMAGMRHVTRATLRDVVSEFVTELEELGLAFPRSVPNALSVIEPSISDTAAEKIREFASGGKVDDPWAVVNTLTVEKMAEILDGESIEICAVAMSKLDVAKAAELMGQFPGERSRRIAYTMSRTNMISPSVVKRIGNALVDQIRSEPKSAFPDPPAARVGSILNFARASTRDDVLAGLIDEDEVFGTAVKKEIFTFKDIRSRVDPRDVPRVLRDVDNDVLITAMAAANALEAESESVTFLLENMSQRLGAQLQEDMAALGKVKEKDAEDAMNAVVAAVRTLQENGEIAAVMPDEEEDDA